MRLTNVAQMDLPRGRLSSFEVGVGARGDTLPLSFDQDRHVAMGERPGSWMAIALRLPGPATPDDLGRAWSAVLARHATMHSVFGRTEAGLSLHDVELVGGTWVTHDVTAGREVRDVVRDVLDAACTPFSAPSHRLCLVEPEEGPPTIVIGSDHSHVDMWSLLVLARDLLRSLADEDLSRDPAGFEAHTAELAARPSAPADVHQRWNQILAASGGVMPCFPLPLGDVSVPRPEVVEVRDVLDADQASRMSRSAHAQGVRMLAVVLAAMTEVTQRLAGESLRAVFPVHSRYDESWHDSVGWFITNSVVECETTDLPACSRALKEAMALGSWPLADIFEPFGGMPADPGMFAISWLDLGRLPVAIDPALEAQFVSAVIETDGVMVWFIKDDAGLRLRCRYPDTPEARRSVGQWLDQVCLALTAPFPA